MTDTEIQKLNEQAAQDAITLDYTKWSAQRRQAKLPDAHNLWQHERDLVIARQQRENESAKQNHLNRLAAQRAEKQTEFDSQIELELLPQKTRLKNQWLADHPDKTPADFESTAWGKLKANLLDEHKQLALQAEIAQGQASGRYAL